MDFSTIAAISTPHGKGGVSLIRVSGAETADIAGKVFFPAGNKKIGDYPPRHAIYGEIVSPKGEVMDDGLLTFFPAPHSFTGEDVAEICCHGGEMITSMVLSALLEQGARLAERGEFSRRAFVNGKMSLTSAEGIADLLDAKTESAALLSSSAARGKLSERLDALSEKILSAASSLWAYIDYPEEDLQSLTDAELLESIKNCIADCEKLIQSYKTGRAVNSGIGAVIAGKPNAGKSTLFNALLGEERAIVTSVPGTTRDVLEYPLKLGRVLVNLSDTAGIRGDTDDEIERIGIGKAIRALGETELVFAVFDLSSEFDENDIRLLSEIIAIKDKVAVIPVLTKGDLEEKFDISAIKELGIPITVRNGEEWDFSELIKRVESLFVSDEAMLREGGILSNARQRSQIVSARTSLENAQKAILSGNKDVASLDMEEALAKIKEIDGKTAGEMILNDVFSRFCVGK